MSAAEKTCTKCGASKLLKEFYLAAGGVAGRRAECKECGRAVDAAYRKANPEKRRENHAAWRKANQDALRAKKASWRKTHPEKVRTMKAAHYEAHRDAVKARAAAWAAANPEKVRAIKVAWEKAHPEASIARTQRRRARLSDVDSGITDEEMKSTIKSAFEMSLGICAYCLGPFDDTPSGRATLDHVTPISKGGRTVPDNIVVACGSCNSKKGHRSLFTMLSQD